MIKRSCKRLKRRSKATAVRIFIISLLVLVLCSGGVWATFSYSTGSVAPISDDALLGINDFFYPTDKENLDDYITIINNVLNGVKDENGKTIAGGLNDPDSKLNQEMRDRVDFANRWGILFQGNAETIGSMDAWVRNDLAPLVSGFDNPNMSFILDYATGEEGVAYYLYLSSADLGTVNNHATTITPVYKAKIVKSGDKYVVQGIEKGEAPWARYKQAVAGTIINDRVPGYDVKKWVKTE